MATNRIFYACQAVGFGPDNGNATDALTGVQSVGCEFHVWSRAGFPAWSD